MKNSTVRRLLYVLPAVMLLASTWGCAAPRLGGRLFSTAETPPPAASQPQYVSGRMPLPSQQAVQPAAMSMPTSGRYDSQSMEDIRTRQRSGGGLGGSSRSNCFS